MKLELMESTDDCYAYDGDKLLSYNNESCTYNSVGNPTIYRGKAVAWQYENRLVGYDTLTFAYDAFGRRISKGELTFTYDSEGRLVSQSNGLKFFYDHTGVAGFTYNNQTYFYMKSVQGDISALLDSTGGVLARYMYDAWGNHVVTDNSGVEITDTESVAHLNPFRYRSYYYDTETKLYFLKTRYYDPEIGRFMTIDGIEYLDPETINGLNLYAYCGNNPVSNVDPNGNDFWSWLLGGLSLVAGAILCFVPGGQAIGAALIVGGASITASNIMAASGVDSKIASLISSGLDIVAGIALCFVPGMQGLGASLIGSGTLGIAGGYISEALGGSFELGATIGNIIGSFVGGKIYNSIHYPKIAKQGILIGKAGDFEAEAIRRGLAYYNGLPGYKGIEKILGKTITSKLGWAHNYTYISNVMKYGGTIYNLGGSATNSYGKELALIAKKAYKFFVNLF